MISGIHIPRRRLPAGALGPIALLLACLGAIAGLLAPGCLSTGSAALRVKPVSAEAAAAFEEARAWARGTLVLPTAEEGPAEPVRGEGDNRRSRERSLAAARRAASLAPDWVAPRRMIDVHLAADLLGIDALAAQRRELERHPDDAALLYLVGRLEGEAGGARFERSITLDANLSWPHHGMAYLLSSRGDLKGAIRHQRLALERARDGFERSYFSSSLARYEVALDRPERALEVLQVRLSAPDLSPVDAVELSVQAALIELGLPFKPQSRRGYERALELLRESDLTDEEIRQLVQRLRLYRRSDGTGSLELQLALAAQPGRARDRLRAELLLETRSTPLALGLLQRGRATRRDSTAGPLLRAARFAAGQFRLGVEEWLSDLPEIVLDEQGLPRDPLLRAVVEAASSLPPAPPAQDLARLGALLVEAGWFREARSVASTLAAQDLDEALRIEELAATGLDLLASVRRVMQSYDEERGRGALPLGSSGGSLEPSFMSEGDVTSDPSVRGMLLALSPLLSRAQPLFEGPEPASAAKALELSPLMQYGRLGALVHPGPWYSESDQRQGRGVAGERVPGLASVLDRLGRFGVFGAVVGGGGPDGTVLQRVLVEKLAGEHFGVPWSGTVVWCEGADLRSRAGRRGANISGAALHEGYWIDFDALRRERDSWALFQAEFFRRGEVDRIDRALSTRGLDLAASERDVERRREERRSVGMLLGEADRVRLAVLRDRAAARIADPSSPGDELLGLDELVHVTATHEEAHLCDRTRFLPLSRNLMKALRLLSSCGFSPAKVGERLEYRAELTALCQVRDPRVVLVGILRAAEGGGVEITPHGGAYRQLLLDLIATLDEELERHPELWPELSPDHVLAHQLHWLSSERLRELARLQATKEGLR